MRISVEADRTFAAHRAHRRVLGQALVELALAIVILFTLICAIFEFSWTFYNYSYLNNAVSKGVRRGIVGDTNAQISTVVMNAGGGLPVATCSILVKTPSGTSLANTDRTTGNYLTVTATINYPKLTPLSSLIEIANVSTLQAQASSRIEF